MNLHTIKELAERIEELEKENSFLKNIAFKDELTKVYNRNYYNTLVEDLENKIMNLTVLIVDCNNLKHINDTYGHLMGDEYIIATANILKKAFPNSEICRIGGDEFVVILKNDIGALYDIGVNYLKRMNNRKHISNGEVVSFSYGSAYGYRNISELLELADSRMYEMKRAYHSLKEMVA